MQDTPHRDNFPVGAGVRDNSDGTGKAMDKQTRNEFEQLCALAEIEEDPEKFLEISRNLVRILDEKQVRLNRQRPVRRVRNPTAASSMGLDDAG
jgi:hypothetical protein